MEIFFSQLTFTGKGQLHFNLAYFVIFPFFIKNINYLFSLDNHFILFFPYRQVNLFQFLSISTYNLLQFPIQSIDDIPLSFLYQQITFFHFFSLPINRYPCTVFFLQHQRSLLVNLKQLLFFPYQETCWYVLFQQIPLPNFLLISTEYLAPFSFQIKIPRSISFPYQQVIVLISFHTNW